MAELSEQTAPCFNDAPALVRCQGLPFLILLYLAIVNPAYLEPLFTTTIGIVMLIVAGSMMGLGIFVMSRMVKIDV